MIINQAPSDPSERPQPSQRPDRTDPEPSPTHLRIITLNIRYATTTPSAGEHPWPTRQPALSSTLNFLTAAHPNAFLCLQEVLSPQLTSILTHLGPAWSHIGVGRDDGASAGEHSPILYRSSLWRCEHASTRWLSPTPDVPSRAWDAALPRIATIGVFSHKYHRPTRRVVVISTHFDHLGVEARRNSARLLLEWSREFPPDHAPILLIGGDFNSTPLDDAYRAMTAPNSGFADIAHLVAPEKHYGNHLTYTSFGEPDEAPQKIDFLFIRQPSAARVATFAVLPNSFDDQIRISDHRPVVSDLEVD